MFYAYSSEEKKLVVKKVEMLMVAEFAQLQRAWGWNALQYLILFSASASPFYRSKPSELERHAAVADTIRQEPWDAGGKKIQKNFFEDPTFKIASDKFVKEFDDHLEMRQEAALKNARELFLRDIEKAVMKPDLTDEDKSKLEKAGDGLVKMTKLHESSRNLVKDHILSDEPTVIFGDFSKPNT